MEREIDRNLFQIKTHAHMYTNETIHMCDVNVNVIANGQIRIIIVTSFGCDRTRVINSGEKTG